MALLALETAGSNRAWTAAGARFTTEPPGAITSSGACASTCPFICSSIRHVPTVSRFTPNHHHHQAQRYAVLLLKLTVWVSIETVPFGRRKRMRQVLWACM